jgi:putative tryptophan/tyrosine transport system permease protein
MLDLLLNAAMQASAFGIGAVGVAISFRVIRYPDLTADGSFMLGSAIFAALLGTGTHWLVAAIGACLGGVAAGMLTALISEWIKVTRLLSGILSTMICYSLSFRLLDGSPNRSLQIDDPPWASASPVDTLSTFVPALAVAFVVRGLLRSELGLLLRATGSNSDLVAGLGRSPRRYTLIGLGVANGLVALAAVAASGQQGFVDLNLGIGVVITLLSGVLLGEAALRLVPRALHSGFALRIVAPFVGSLLYFFMYLLVLRASLRDWIPISIEPADLKLLSAIVLIALVGSRRRKARDDFPI